ncbi:MAG: BMP family ABC transporter substrate-binding protein [Methylocystaceae bacterium]|nr:BMP family ABC transporter substrate-binding protein [Methylocystaceae bacterium]
MRKYFLFIMTVFLALGMGIAQAEPVKIGFVYVATAGQAGYTYQHDLARQQIVKKYGDQVRVRVANNVPEGRAAEKIFNDFAQEGYQLVFATTFGYMSSVLKVAKKFPDTAFEHATGYKRYKNLNTFMPRYYEGRYLMGVVAGKMTRSNVIGYVASYPIPEVVRGINAFTQGVRHVNKNAVIRVQWVNSWLAPEKERKAADHLIAASADVLTFHVDSPATVEAAQTAGVYALGYHSDLSQYGPDAHLTAMVTNWVPYYMKRIDEVLNGTWQGNQNTRFGLKEDAIQIAPFHPVVPQTVQALVMKAKADIITGKLNPFTGPLYDNDGRLRVKVGTQMSQKQLDTFNWFVDGVDDKLPN